MRRQSVCSLFAVSSLLLAPACTSPEEVEQDLSLETSTSNANSSSNFEELEAVINPEADAVAFEDTEEDGEALREFTYSWPRQVSALPKLVSLLERERDSDLAKQKDMWAQSLEEFPGDDCYSCKRLGYGREWKVVANLERFLSLSADHYEYTGGAHGNYWFDAKVWDREEETALNPRELFISPEALWGAIEEPYCVGLDAERGDRFPGEDVNTLGWGCPGLDELTLLVGSSNGKTFDRLGLLAAPYVAGSYAEGAYEVTLPVTEAVLQAVASGYQDAFSVQ